MSNIIVGDLFTISPNKVIRDRSYLDDIWRCITETETQIWAKTATGSRGWLGDKPVCFIKAEHDFHRTSEASLNIIKEATPDTKAA